MPKINFPENILNIISVLNGAGHSAYAVGGCIRDCLRNEQPDDWDIATSALPEQTMELFGERALPTGLKHGTVTVKTELCPVEITTYRADGSYSDHRRPDSVRFVTDIADDLSRRDFTVNAMAASPDGSFLDPFGGVKDIEKKLIRCVGDAEKRFDEDALRMFRALRLSAKLGFDIESATLSAIRSRALLSTDIAVERICAELTKMLVFPCALQLEELFSSGLMSFCCKKGGANFRALDLLPADKLLRCAGMCAVLEKNDLGETKSFLSSLRFDSKTVKYCSIGISAAKSIPQNPAGWKKLIYELGYDACRCACAAELIFSGRNCFPGLEAVLKSGECCTLSDLAVNGGDLEALGIRGRDIGATLKKLLLHVIENPSDNTKEKLLSII